MRPIRLLSVLLCAAAFCCGTAAGTEPDRIRIACYNVESLFDTVPDPSAGDAEFTPHSPRRWNTERYRMKINHISRVIDDLDADLLALAEVENEAVVHDLMYAMRSDYNYIHRNSGDPRGMDVVLLYRGSRFFPTRVRQVFGRGLTRSLLTVDGELLGESVTLILCHLPSQMNAARYRAEAFRSLRRTVDSLLTGSPQRKLVVLGDFNAEPDARESRKILHVRPETALRNAPADPSALYTPFVGLRRQGYGTLVYRDRRQLFDYILVSGAFASGNGLRYGGRCGIFVRDYLIHRSGPWKGYPIRTFQAGRYTGGYSDHLPVFLDFENKKPESPEVR